MKRNSLRPIQRREAGGFVLIEALVALLIFSFGVLGVIGLQAAMTKAQTSSKYRADASFLAQHLVGSIWADRPNIAQYATAQCSSNARCNDWSAKVASLLPGGTSTVTVNAASGVVTILIRWTPPNEETHSYTASTTINL